MIIEYHRPETLGGLFEARHHELVGARFSLQCIQQFGAGQAAGDAPKQTQ